MSIYQLNSFKITYHDQLLNNNINLFDINSKISEKINECTSCSLHINSKNKVILRGSLKPKILFIGEAPGYTEDQTGKPFSGVSGKKLEQLIEYIGLNFDDYSIINIIKCRPPLNRKPLRKEVESCLKYLKLQILLLDPILLILLGNTAEETFRYNLYKSKLDWGKIKRTYDNRYVLKLYHPAALLYNINLCSIQKSFIDNNRTFINKIIFEK